MTRIFVILAARNRAMSFGLANLRPSLHLTVPIYWRFLFRTLAALLRGDSKLIPGFRSPTDRKYETSEI
jgi:hypothetical protein